MYRRLICIFRLLDASMTYQVARHAASLISLSPAPLDAIIDAACWANVYISPPRRTSGAFIKSLSSDDTEIVMLTRMPVIMMMPASIS